MYFSFRGSASILLSAIVFTACGSAPSGDASSEQSELKFGSSGPGPAPYTKEWCTEEGRTLTTRQRAKCKRIVFRAMSRYAARDENTNNGAKLNFENEIEAPIAEESEQGGQPLPVPYSVQQVDAIEQYRADLTAQLVTGVNRNVPTARFDAGANASVDGVIPTLSAKGDRTYTGILDGSPRILSCTHYRYWRFHEYYQNVMFQNENTGDAEAITDEVFKTDGVGVRLAQGLRLRTKSAWSSSDDKPNRAFVTRTRTLIGLTLRNEFYNLNGEERNMLAAHGNQTLTNAISTNGYYGSVRILPNTPQKRWDTHKDMHDALANEAVEELEYYYRKRQAFISLRDNRRKVISKLNDWRGSLIVSQLCTKARNGDPLGIITYGGVARSEIVSTCNVLDMQGSQIVSALQTALSNGCIGHTSAAWNTCDWSIRDFTNDLRDFFDKRAKDEEARCQELPYSMSEIQAAVNGNDSIDERTCVNGDYNQTLEVPANGYRLALLTAGSFHFYMEAAENRREGVLDCLQSSVQSSGGATGTAAQEAKNEKWGSNDGFKVCLERDLHSSHVADSDDSWSDVDTSSIEDIKPKVGFEFALTSTFKKKCTSTSGTWTPLKFDYEIPFDRSDSDGKKETCERRKNSSQDCGNGKNSHSDSKKFFPNIMGIQLTVTVGVTGQVGMYTEQYQGPIANNAHDTNREVKIHVTPFVDLGGFASAAVGVEPFAAVGIRGDLTILTASLPSTARAYVEYQNSVLTVGTEFKSDLDIATLDGTLSIYTTLLWQTYQKEIFSWNGYKKSYNLIDANWQHDVADLSAIGL